MAKRISELAKELSIPSKDIIAKCVAEGVPADKVKGHMSTLSAGLEASIREWFAGGVSSAGAGASGGAASAVVDAPAEAPPAPPAAAPVVKHARPAPARKRADGEHDAPASDTAVARAPVAPPAAEPPAQPPSQAPPAGTPAPGPTAEPVATPATSTPAPASIAAPVAPAPAATPAAPAPSAPSAPSAPARAVPRPMAPPPPARVVAPVVAPPPAPAAQPAGAPGSGQTLRPAASAGEGGPGGSAPTATGAGVSGPGSAAPQRPEMRSGPQPTMNVPTRPTVVSPAGSRVVPEKVVLSGPKVVRVEQPDHVEAPRPRRIGPPGSGPSGPRPGGYAGGGDDRNRRPGPGGPPGPGARRPNDQRVPDRRRGRAGAEWSPNVISEQDLAEREARLSRSGGFVKQRRAKEALKRPGMGGAGMEELEDGPIRIAAPFTIKELSAATGVKGADIVKKLFLQGVMATINSPIAPEKATEIMMDFDIDLEVVEAKTAEETVSDAAAAREMKDVRPRGPVVTILGHVDHGKTSLLDKIRNANVAAGEAGGITQRTSAFVAEVDTNGEKRQVVFLDTPGHEAFTGMRARGAKITDVVVLVVSAPEGVMPQTVESINHAKAAGVPIVVALNKVDRPDATEQQVQKTLGQLAGAGLNVIEWGGDVESVRVSAVTGQGIPQLLETLLLQADVLELKADFDGPAQGTVIEARMEEGRGAVASILLQQGKLEVGDFVVMGRAFGRIRDITDDKGRRVKQAVPPMAVVVSGVDEVCDAGDKFYVTDTLRQAEDAAEQRRQRERLAALAQPKVTLDNLFSQMKDRDVKEILVVIKAAEQGTVDVLKAECEKIKTDEVKVRVLDAGVGGITESNVILADASKAIIIGFNVIPSGKARALAEQKGVEIRTYQVIYDITDDLRKAAEGLLAPELREEVLGHAEVRQVFRISKVGSVAGCYVTDGTVQRDALIRVTRNGVVVEHDRKLAQLKRIKDDAKEVRAGVECGMKIDGYDDIKEGDILECYKKIEVKRTL